MLISGFYHLHYKSPKMSWSIVYSSPAHDMHTYVLILNFTVAKYSPIRPITNQGSFEKDLIEENSSHSCTECWCEQRTIQQNVIRKTSRTWPRPRPRSLQTIDLIGTTSLVGFHDELYYTFQVSHILLSSVHELVWHSFIEWSINFTIEKISYDSIPAHFPVSDHHLIWDFRTCNTAEKV